MASVRPTESPFIGHHRISHFRPGHDYDSEANLRHMQQEGLIASMLEGPEAAYTAVTHGDWSHVNQVISGQVAHARSTTRPRKHNHPKVPPREQWAQMWIDPNDPFLFLHPMPIVQPTILGHGAYILMTPRPNVPFDTVTIFIVTYNFTGTIGSIHLGLRAFPYPGDNTWIALETGTNYRSYLVPLPMVALLQATSLISEWSLNYTFGDTLDPFTIEEIHVKYWLNGPDNASPTVLPQR